MTVIRCLDCGIFLGTGSEAVSHHRDTGHTVEFANDEEDLSQYEPDDFEEYNRNEADDYRDEN